MQSKKKYYDKEVQFFYHFKALPQKNIYSLFSNYVCFLSLMELFSNE